MTQFIVNPRCAPRAPARCRTTVVATSYAFESQTEDIGSHGCQLVAPRLIRKGDAVQLTVRNEGIAGPLRVAGRVAWVSPQAPWRVGVAFDDGSVREATRWFGKLVASQPGMAGFSRVPDRIAGDAMVYLGPPPRFLLDFTPDEAMLLRAIASGARIDELQARLQDGWATGQRALFSLIARQAVTLSRGQAVHPDAWKQILVEVESSLAIESMGKAPQPPRAAASPPPLPSLPGSARASQGSGAPADGSRWSAEPIQNPSRMIDLPPEGGPPLELAVPRRASRATMRTIDFAGWSPGAPPADPVGSRQGGQTRNADAQAAYDRARVEAAAGNVDGARLLLKRALRLCPGDPEIGEALGKLALEGRGPLAR